jgi:hypothetical protein
MQETIPTNAILIEKEQIPNLHFKNAASFEQDPDLRKKLVEATKLGNIHHGKIRIDFTDDGGAKYVETTIWATGGKYICLKGGVWLPISRISKISMV